MRSVIRLILLALVLLVVALISALTAMRFAIHGRQVAVPNLLGRTPAEAFKAADQNGLTLQVERQYYSATVPEGRILSQLPPAGTQVRRGWQIRVAESLGPQRVAIPNVVGDSERAAEINIRRRGLDVGAEAVITMAGAPADQIISQSPPATAQQVAAPKISLLLAAAPQPQAFVMPNFSGQTLASVNASLQAAGMHLGGVTQAGQPAGQPSPPPPPDSLIVSQSPAAGQKIVAGSSVTLQVR